MKGKDPTNVDCRENEDRMTTSIPNSMSMAIPGDAPDRYWRDGFYLSQSFISRPRTLTLCKAAATATCRTWLTPRTFYCYTR